MGKGLFHGATEEPFAIYHFNKEEWKVHPDYPDYWISNHGRIISKPNSRRKSHLLVTGELTKGYRRVTLRKPHGGYGRKFVHRLVAELFIENPHGLTVVNHLNEFPWDNNAENLEWTTNSGNELHGTKQRRNSLHGSKAVEGECISTGVKIYSPTIRFLEKFGFTADKISACCKGNRKSHKGFIWRYIDGKDSASF